MSKMTQPASGIALTALAPVILLHGGLGHSGNWRYQVPALIAKGYRAVVIDSCGHGRSTRDGRPYSYELLASGVLAVMNALHLDRVALVGWSDGACTALVLAAKYPARVAGVFFFACNMDPTGVGPFEPTPALNRCFSRHSEDYKQLSATPEQLEHFVEDVGLMQRTQTLLQGVSNSTFDIGRDGRLLHQTATGEVRAYDPRDGKDLVLGSVPANGWHLLWSPDGRSVAYLRGAHRKDDPDAGLWVTDFKTAPRQVFHGWASWLVLDSQGDIIVLKGKPDLKGELWTVKWDGSGLFRAGQTIPLLYNFNYLHSLAVNQIDASPDGRNVVFQSQQVLQENIGMIENLN
jgi:pimeloyl-ACP methyl ester carboxylesterase